MPTPIRILTLAEYGALEIARRTGSKNGSTQRSDYILPGMGYYCPWYYTPWEPERSGSMKLRREKGLAGETFLSVFYWRDWSDKRPPITLVCPNGREICIDQKASNGPGWHVTGEGNNLTAMPSIVVPGYHGWLKDGAFSDDIEGRGPNGIVGA